MKRNLEGMGDGLVEPLLHRGQRCMPRVLEVLYARYPAL